MKFLMPKLKTLAPPIPEINYYPMFETTQLASTIQAFLDRSKVSEHKGYYAVRDKPLKPKMTVGAFWQRLGWKGSPIS